MMLYETTMTVKVEKINLSVLQNHFETMFHCGLKQQMTRVLGDYPHLRTKNLTVHVQVGYEEAAPDVVEDPQRTSA